MISQLTDMCLFQTGQAVLHPGLDCNSATLLGQNMVVYQWLRLDQLDQWWHWLALCLVCVLILSYVWFWYRRDAAEQLKPVGWALTLLRIAAFVGLLLYFLQLDKRTEQRVVRDSKVAVLVDTSLSMSLPGTPSRAGVTNPVSRAEEATRLIGQSDFLQRLAEFHQVAVYRFDQLDRPAAVAALDKSSLAESASADGSEAPNESRTSVNDQPPEGEQSPDGRRPDEISLPGNGVAPSGPDGDGNLSDKSTNLSDKSTADAGMQAAPATSLGTGLANNGQYSRLQSSRRMVWLACGLGGLAIIMLGISFGALLLGVRGWYPGSVLLLVGTLMAGTGLVLAAFGIVPNTRYSIPALVGLEPPAANPQAEESESGDQPAASLPDDWQTALAPRGVETRLGDALKSILDREAGSPLAGIVLLTDGRSNAGLAPREVLSVAQNAEVPLYVIGLGSATSPPNLELAEVDLPKRVYPGDDFAVTALIGSNGFEGQQVTVQVLAGQVDESLEDLSIESEQEVEIDSEDSLTDVTFELEPKAVGSWQYAVRVIPLKADADAEDNVRTTTLEVVERKNRVLVLAGGPTREYQFVRNLLYRDRDVDCHILLQTATDQTSQEAQVLLTEFPEDRQALSQYDAIIAFDADWTQIPQSSVEALEQWVAEQAGGFVMVAGSVEMPKWLSRSAAGAKAEFLADLSPVVLQRSGSALLAAGRVEAATAWPLSLTSDGRQAELLWLTDEPESSLRLWEEFEGVYSYYAAYVLKPGAKALLQFSDPTAAVDGQLPVYLATQFYGAGRTAFLGGGEMWRIRRLGDQYFDRFYTKLVRWVSQGRLLLDSDRGVLLVDREEAILGDQVGLRAVLKNERYEPLVQSEVVARLIDPLGRNVPVVLRPLADGSQPGVYTGQFSILMPGEYTAQIQLGSLASDEMLDATVTARVPALEMQRGERNDDLLRRLAGDSGGKYWTGIEDAVAANGSGQAEIIALIAPKDQVAFLPGAPDTEFQLRWLGWLMTWIAGALSLEWLTRRLHRLA